MRFFAFIAASVSVFSAATGANAASAFTTEVLGNALGGLLTPANFYGAPIPPWQSNSDPGWYYGENPQDVVGLTLPWLLDELICDILALLNIFHCPQPQPQSVWTQTFNNLTGATESSTYLTYGLVDTIADCETMCLGVSGCTFINTYDDVNGKGGSPLLTCALFSECQDASTAINFGGQTQPSGLLDFIENSNGFCHSESS